METILRDFFTIYMAGIAMAGATILLFIFVDYGIFNGRISAMLRNWIDKKID